MSVQCVQTDLKPVKIFLSCRSCRSSWALGTGAIRVTWVLTVYEKLVIGLQK